MEGLVYLLCAATAELCALLLLRGYRRSRARLLFWCGLCFLLLGIENVVLFVDHVILPNVKLWPIRRTLALAAIAVLLFGLIWDSRREQR